LEKVKHDIVKQTETSQNENRIVSKTPVQGTVKYLKNSLKVREQLVYRLKAIGSDIPVLEQVVAKFKADLEI
jgi:hypothetical protein